MGFMSYREPATGSFSCILWYKEEAGTVWFCPFHAHYFVFTQISLRLRASAIAAVLFLTPNLRYVSRQWYFTVASESFMLWAIAADAMPSACNFSILTALVLKEICSSPSSLR